MIKILYEDNFLLVCVKPAGTLCEMSEEKNSLPRILSQENNTPIFTVHRLDREVCGVMVYAKNQSAAAKLSAAIAERRFEKEYLAIIEGTSETPAAELKDLLFRDKRKNKTYVVNRKRQGVKDASLEYTTLASIDNTSLLKIKLHTGRTHQIRVQLASRKHPIVGDRKYGSNTSNSAIALCSHKISFKHPETNTPLCFTYLPEEPEIWNIYQSLTRNE
ncbi:MAG: RNA pseudouridine synthase [Clostridia bacterium]|nr:RNA pseudouridine synthase [Clostridia bacterium]